MLFKPRALLIVLAALLLMGSFAEGTAYGVAGPFFYEREAGTKGEEQILGEGAGTEAEQIKGRGGEQILKGTVGTTSIELKSAGVKITGYAWNGALQGQAKLELKYLPVTVVEPKVKECQAEIFSQPGAHNTVFLESHLAWTWNGEAKQLEEQPIVSQKPDLVFTPPRTQIQEGAKELPKGTLAEVKLAGAGCGVLAGTFSVTGSAVAALKPEGVEKWSKVLKLTTQEGKSKQHFWNGKEFIGAETGLVLAGNPASLVGETEIESEEELAVLENANLRIAVNPAQIITSGVGAWKAILKYKVEEGNWVPGMPQKNIRNGMTAWLTVTNLNCTGTVTTGNSCEVELKFSEPNLSRFRAYLRFEPAPEVGIYAND